MLPMTPELEDEAGPPAPVMTPERAQYLSRALTAMATLLVDSMLADLAAGHSTDGADSPTGPGSTPADRLMVRALRPFLPKLRATFLAKLSSSDPAGLERLMGATATTLETIIAQAPGEPMPRWTWEWLPGERSPRLVPFDPRA